MARSSSNLSVKQEKAIIALLTHGSVENAAHAAGVGVRTLYRWLKEDDDFEAAYRAAKREAYGQSIARLHHLSSAAVSTLGKVMLDPKTPPATRVRAADSILNHTTKAIEVEGVEERMAELEQAVEDAKPGATRHLGLAS